MESEASVSNEESIMQKWTTSTRSSAASGYSHRFTGNAPGPKGEAWGAMDYVLQNYLNLLLTQSNLYANQQRIAKNDGSPWTPIGLTKLMAFIGLNMAMGVIPLPSLHT